MPRRTRTAGWAAVVVVGLAFASSPAADDDLTRALGTLKAVGREGQTNDAAGLAWKSVVRQGGPALLPALAAIDDGNATAANWLRTAVDAIAEGEKAAGRTLPADKLEAFARDTKNAPSARRIAYELLVSQDKAAAERLLPGFLNDASSELRRDAVAAEFDKLEKSAKATNKTNLERLFKFTRDKDQVELIARKLEKDYQVKVSVTEHLSFVTQWSLVGPFESVQGKALTTANPPEAAKDATGKFKGKGGADATWKPFAASDSYGVVDLNKEIGKIKNASAYALAVIVAEKETPCEVRVGTINAVQIFLNGKKLFEREEYHHGMTMDYHVGKGTLTAGENVLLVKVCQNDQTDSWAQNWMFQARVCDATGGALPGVSQVAVTGPKKPLPLGFVPPSAEPKEEKK